MDTLEYLIKTIVYRYPYHSSIRNFKTEVWKRINLLYGIREVKEKRDRELGRKREDEKEK